MATGLSSAEVAVGDEVGLPGLEEGSHSHASGHSKPTDRESFTDEPVSHAGDNALPTSSVNVAADPDQTLVQVGGGDNDTSGSTLVGNGEGMGNTASPVVDGYSVTVLPNGTKMYIPVAGTQPGTVRPGVKKVPTGTSSRSKKRTRKERQEEDKEPEVEVAEVAPKRPRVQAPPLMPNDKFCLVFPPPAGFLWEEFRGVKIEYPPFFQEHLPVESVEDVERVVNWWRQEWEDKASNLTFLMALPWKVDPSGSAKKLIRFAQPLCDRMREELGPEYYDKLMDPAKKKFYGHVYYKMCMDVQKLVKRKWHAEEEATADVKVPVAATVNQERKRKNRDEDGEEDASAASEKKKQKKEKAPPRILGVDGKIIRQRGRMRGHDKTHEQYEDNPEMWEALQRQLLNASAPPR